VEPKVLALVRTRFLRHFPYLDSSSGVVEPSKGCQGKLALSSPVHHPIPLGLVVEMDRFEHPEAGDVHLGLEFGRTAALHYRSSTLHQIYA
jgi:hypothetical protein